MSKAKAAISLPSGIIRRMLTMDEAAAYLGVSPGVFETEVRPRIPVARFGGAVRVDIRALDLYLDRMSGLDTALAQSQGELDAAFGAAGRG